MTTDSTIITSLCHSLGAQHWRKVETIQRLWSGYGEIARYASNTGNSVVVKHVSVPEEVNHPRGWGGQLSQQRKLDSYQAEAHFYQTYAEHCDQACRVPRLLLSIPHVPSPILVMEDLDSSGFGLRASTASNEQIRAVLSWLAVFHAQHLGVEDSELWPIGTYWHLDTRPDEFEVMPPGRIKAAAQNIDDALNKAIYKTLVHGDAKVANFCFSEDGKKTAAVDFQYVGGGVGIKDVAYFLGSCLNEEELINSSDKWLDYYFEQLRIQMTKRGMEPIAGAVEAEWCRLYPLAWADFFRFLMGWSPTHYKINRYMQAMAERALGLL